MLSRLEILKINQLGSLELRSIMVVKERRSDLRQGRVVGAVIAVAMLLWLLAQWLGPHLGLPGRYALLRFFSISSFPVGHNIWDNNVAGTLTYKEY